MSEERAEYVVNGRSTETPFECEVCGGKYATLRQARDCERECKAHCRQRRIEREVGGRICTCTESTTAAAPSGTSECSCSALRSLGDTLEMWVNMLREHCEDPANGLPSPFLIDDWMRDYREEWAAQNTQDRPRR